MARRVPSEFRWFVAGVASWAAANSMSQVVFSWLLVGVLRAEPGWVGVAQMCQALPALAFVPIGGLLADRLALRRMIGSVHLAAALSASALALLVGGGQLGLGVLLPYALCWGTTQALAIPPRDAMISHVAGSDLLRAITATTLVQFVASAAGAQLGGLAERLGSGPVLALQAGVAAAGLAVVLRLPRVAPHPAAAAGASGTLAALRSGLVEVARSERLRPVALLVATNGILFMGPFQVLCPLLVRDVYRGGAHDLALQWMVLPIGAIAGSLAVLVRGGIRRKGLAFLASLFGVGLCVLGIAARPPFAGFLALIFAWGVLHSLLFNTSRTLFQEAASAENRARVLSVHSLGLIGMAPASNLAFGFLARAVGPAAGCALAAAAMLAVAGAALAASRVRRFES